MHPSDPRFIAAATPLAIVKRRRRKSASGSIGSALRRSTATNAAAASAATTAAVGTASISANVVAASAVDPSAIPATSRRRPRGSALSRTTRAVRDRGGRDDREVDQEDPPPARAGDEQATRNRAGRQRQPGDRGPHADRPGALARLWERVRDDRERAGQQQRRADSLRDAGRDEHAARRRR